MRPHKEDVTSEVSKKKMSLRKISQNVIHIVVTSGTRCCKRSFIFHWESMVKSFFQFFLTFLFLFFHIEVGCSLIAQFESTVWGYSWRVQFKSTVWEHATYGCWPCFSWSEIYTWSEYFSWSEISFMKWDFYNLSVKNGSILLWKRIFFMHTKKHHRKNF